MREQDNSTVGRFDWGIQKLPAEENGDHGASLGYPYICSRQMGGMKVLLEFCISTHDLY